MQAAGYHLATLLAVPVALYAPVAWTATADLRPAAASRYLMIVSSRILHRAWLVYAVFFLLYTVVFRNLAWEPFTWFCVPNLT